MTTKKEDFGVCVCVKREGAKERVELTALILPELSLAPYLYSSRHSVPYINLVKLNSISSVLQFGVRQPSPSKQVLSPSTAHESPRFFSLCLSYAVQLVAPGCS